MVLDNFKSILSQPEKYSSNSFFIITLILSIILIRIINWIIKNIFQIDFFHHFFIGVILLIIIYLMIFFRFYKIKNKIFNVLLIFSIGLIIDQFIYLIVREKTGQGYWELPSFLGMIVFLICFSLFLLILSFINYKKINKNDMKKENRLLFISTHKDLFLLYFSVLLIIFISRGYVILVPDVSFLIFGYEIHHLFFGTLFLLFVIIGIYVFYDLKINKSYIRLIVVSIGIGIGLIIDEFIFLISGGITNKDYWNFNSKIGLLLLFVSFSLIYFLMYYISKKPALGK